jgi:hypothetical protein
MFTRVTLSDFRDAFRSHGRRDQFSYDGLRVIFEYLEEYEDSTGSAVELDVVAICCDYVEMTPEEIIEAYSIDFDPDADDAETVAIDHLEYHSMILGKTKDTIVFQQF